MELQKLEESKHIVISGEWKKNNAGGSHLHSDEFVHGNEASWQVNPKFLLSLTGEGKTDVEVVLSRPQWKMSETKKKEVVKDTQGSLKDEKKKAKSIVGTMLGLYIFENRGQKILKKSESLEDVIFYPKNEIIKSYSLTCNENGYILMPCTFEVITINYLV